MASTRVLSSHALPTRALSVRALNRASSARLLSTALPRRNKLFGGPAPPRLPEEDQKIFEDLQRSSTGAFSTPRQRPQINQSPASTSHPQVNHSPVGEDAPLPIERAEVLKVDAKISAKGDGEELHPNIRRGAPPEFEGDTNPQTGEVGGPKNDPLRWKGDWSYNGRVTDF